MSRMLRSRIFSWMFHHYWFSAPRSCLHSTTIIATMLQELQSIVLPSLLLTFSVKFFAMMDATSWRFFKHHWRYVPIFCFETSLMRNFYGFLFNYLTLWFLRFRISSQNSTAIDARHVLSSICYNGRCYAPRCSLQLSNVLLSLVVLRSKIFLAIL